MIAVFMSRRVITGGAGFLSGLAAKYRDKQFISANEDRSIAKFFPKFKVPPLITPVGIYSITMPKHAKEIADLIKRKVPDAKIITDATSGVGGNVIAFSRVFEKVNAIEMNEDNALALKHNIEAYGLKNVTMHRGNSVELVPELKQDVIFVDPPWGGPEYREHAEFLKLGGRDMNDLAREWLKYAKMIVIKAPLGYEGAGEKIKIGNYQLILVRT